MPADTGCTWGAQPHGEPESGTPRGQALGIGIGVRTRALHLSHCDPVDCGPPSLLCPWDSPGKKTGVGCRALLQGIFPTQGLKCSTTNNINPSNKNSPQTVKQAQASYLVLPSKPPCPRC